MDAIDTTLTGLELGPPTSHRRLTVYPLTGTTAGEPNYLLLDAALDAGLCEVTEVSEAGSVPELAFLNRADKPVLLLDGEELVGARQNRVLNITILIGAGQKLVIPVSCVEQGRWAWRSRNFSSARRTMFAQARRDKMEQVSNSLHAFGGRYADQGAIWGTLYKRAAAFDVDSPTGAMADIYEDVATSLDEIRRGFTSAAGQVGAVFALGNEVAGLELFDAPSTFETLLPKLVDSYAMDALEQERAGDAAGEPAPEAVRDFIDQVRNAGIETYPALGEGTDVRLRGPRLVGGALQVDDRIVHLSAFRMPGTASDNGKPQGRPGRLASLASRRRGRDGR